MRTHFYDRIATLERENAVFAVATVVARRAPVSSHLGDRALVFADGHMEGFVGGSCSRDIVRRHALGAIANRQPVLLQIRNAGSLSSDESGDSRAKIGESETQREALIAATERVVIPMSCASEGAVDVYIEPRVPARRLLVVGLTPVAEALARLASTLDFAVARVVIDDELRDVPRDPDASVVLLSELRDFLAALEHNERRALVAIVASQGHYDELALEILDPFDIAFLGLVASRRRAATVFGVLAQQGVAAERLAMIRNPVGLDIGARTPGDVAISILAEIIANSGAEQSDAPVSLSPVAGLSAEDPVCKMDVETAGALYHLEHDGKRYFFCCAGCRASFSAEPERYLIALGTA
jgi:xanthine dehydrogenase accessory factor